MACRNKNVGEQKITLNILLFMFFCYLCMKK